MDSREATIFQSFTRVETLGMFKITQDALNVWDSTHGVESV